MSLALVPHLMLEAVTPLTSEDPHSYSFYLLPNLELWRFTFIASLPTFHSWSMEIKLLLILSRTMSF